MNFRVDLDTFRGPMDLLLYLVRKHEIDIADLPIAMVTEQFLDYLSVLEKLDVDAVGDFLEMASTLIEIKSRMVLPHGGEESEQWEDPRQELVQRLLEYKKFKDAASILQEQSRAWQQRYTRLANDLPQRQIELDSQPIQSVELWDLVSAMGRIMRDTRAIQPASIVYDDTPIQHYMQQIHNKLIHARRIALSEMFDTTMHKSAMIGVFLSILELVRQHCVSTEQHETHGEIWVLRGENFNASIDFSLIDDYDSLIDDGDFNGSTEDIEPSAEPSAS